MISCTFVHVHGKQDRRWRGTLSYSRKTWPTTKKKVPFLLGYVPVKCRWQLNIVWFWIYMASYHDGVWDSAPESWWWLQNFPLCFFGWGNTKWSLRGLLGMVGSWVTHQWFQFRGCLYRLLRFFFFSSSFFLSNFCFYFMLLCGSWVSRLWGFWCLLYFG